MADTSHKLTKAELSITLLAAAGAAFMAYLVSVHFERGGSALCDLAPGFSCQVVNQSVYSEVLGVPISVLGLTYFLAVLVAVLGKFKGALRAIEVFTIGAVVFSLYLTGVELYLLASICVFCELSKVVMLLILGIAHRTSHRRGDATAARWHALAAASGFVGAFLVHWLQG